MPLLGILRLLKVRHPSAVWAHAGCRPRFSATMVPLGPMMVGMTMIDDAVDHDDVNILVDEAGSGLLLMMMIVRL